MNSYTAAASQPFLSGHSFLAALFLAFSPAAVVGADSTPSADKPYLLYLGADLSIEHGGKLRPVKDVRGESFVIDADGKLVSVSTRKSDLKIKVDNSVKISSGHAMVENLKAERVYTWANNPIRRDQAAMELSSMAAEATDRAVANLNSTQQKFGLGNAAAENWDPRTGPDPRVVSQAQVDAAYNDVDRSAFAQGADINSVGKWNAGERSDQCDALALSFDLSTPKPIGDPYLVLFVHFLENPDDPKSSRQLIYAQSLPGINEKARSIRVVRAGFPPGYKLESYQVHLYDGGNEVATNVAPKQVALTAAQAFQLAVAEYATLNKGKTVPPSPSTAFWPTDLSTRLSAEQRNRTLYAKVGKDGIASGLYEDQACTRSVQDTGLEAVRADLRFHPALEKGKPAEGVVAVNFGR